MPNTQHLPRKRFAQNFLLDDKIVDRIIATIAPKKDDNLLEIGPGQGAITLPLLAKVNQLNVIEIDRDLIALLQSFNKSNLLIHQGDALKFDLTTLPMPLRVIGNLPYNISSPILFYWLENRAYVQDLTFMLQKELAQRLVANYGSKTYGRLSVMMQAFFEVDLIFTVSPESFNPAPKVNSAVVYLKPLKNPLAERLNAFEKIVKIAFSQRRKTLKNALKLQLTQAQTTIDLTQRAEMLKVADFIKLTQDYEKT